MESVSEDLACQETVDCRGKTLCEQQTLLRQRLEKLQSLKAEQVEHVEQLQRDFLSRADRDGIALVFEHSAQTSLQLAARECQQVEAEWPAMVERAASDFAKCLSECRRLLGVLEDGLDLDRQQAELVRFEGRPDKTVRGQVQGLCDVLSRTHRARMDTVAEARRVLEELGSWDDTLFTGSLSLGAVQHVVAAKDRVVAEHRERISSLYVAVRAELEDLCQCLGLAVEYAAEPCGDDWSMAVTHINSMREQVLRLKQRAEGARAIRRLCAERLELIQQMLVFEKSASDPARLFAPSFRLVQEEKFRRSALPTLRRLEQKLLLEMDQWEAENGQAYGGADAEGRSLRERLEKEISERFVNEAVFGFHPTTPAKAKAGGQASENAGANVQSARK